MALLRVLETYAERLAKKKYAKAYFCLSMRIMDWVAKKYRGAGGWRERYQAALLVEFTLHQVVVGTVEQCCYELRVLVENLIDIVL